MVRRGDPRDRLRDIERSKPYGRFPKIRENANYSRRKYDLASVDSITLRVPFEAVPFFPYVSRAQGRKARGKDDPKEGKDGSSFMKREIMEDQGAQVAVAYHNAHRYYEFGLIDTNLLHRSGFSDAHIIRLLTNRILSYFDGRVGLDDIIVTRVDVYRLLDRTEEIEELIASTGLGPEGEGRGLQREEQLEDIQRGGRRGGVLRKRRSTSTCRALRRRTSRSPCTSLA